MELIAIRVVTAEFRTEAAQLVIEQGQLADEFSQ